MAHELVRSSYTIEKEDVVASVNISLARDQICRTAGVSDEARVGTEHRWIERLSAATVSIAASCDAAELMIDHRVGIRSAVIQENMLHGIVGVALVGDEIGRRAVVGDKVSIHRNRRREGILESGRIW